MFVKALHSDGHTSIREVYRGLVYTGHHFATSQPTAQDVLGFNHWNFSAHWGESDQAATGTYDNPQGEVAGDCWELRYAWWGSEEGLIHAVITPYNIFILSDTGKTIDRV